MCDTSHIVWHALPAAGEGNQTDMSRSKNADIDGVVQELTQPITGYGALAKEASTFPTDSDAEWADKDLQKHITENVKANMFFEQRERVRPEHCPVIAMQLLCVCSIYSCYAMSCMIRGYTLL